jgi:membrane-bound ClpP family serine protease
MKANVGGIDRILRIAVGALLIVLAALSVIGAWGYIGIVPVLTGLFRFCPVYPLLGISTCPMKQGQAGS